MLMKTYLKRTLSVLLCIALFTAIINPTTSLAVTNLTVTGHDMTYAIGNGVQTVDPNFTVSCSSNIAGGKIYIDNNFNASKDNLSATTTAGVSGSYNPSTGIMTLSGTTSAENYQAFIRTVKFSTSATSNTSRSIVVSLTTGNGSIIYFSGNGHYYEYIAGSLSWTAARDAAQARSYNGIPGYLATIITAEENAFIAEKCEGDGWLGATDEGHDKEWYWVTGPEGLENNGAGTKFCTQYAYTDPQAGIGVSSTEPGMYHSFLTGEPNDYRTSFDQGQEDGENYLHMYGNASSNPGMWNDYPESLGSIDGYLVEYGTTHHAASGSVASMNITIRDQISPVINSVTGNPTTWTDSDVTLTVNATDSQSGIKEYSFDGGATWQTGNTKTYSSNTTIAANTIKVKDNAGNIASYPNEIAIIKIDKAPIHIYDVSPTALVNKNSVNLKCNKNATIYLVPKPASNYTSKAQLDAITNKRATSCNPHTLVNLSTAGLSAGNYQLYAIDSSNVSAPQNITISYKSNNTVKPTATPKPKKNYTTYADPTPTPTPSPTPEPTPVKEEESAPQTTPDANPSKPIHYEVISEENNAAADGLSEAVTVEEIGQANVSRVDVELVVEKQEADQESKPNYIIKAEESLANDNNELVAAFDISLIKKIYKNDSVETKKVENSDIKEYITVRLLLPEEYKGKQGLTVAYIDDNGEITEFETKVVTVEGKDYLEFATNHFSTYAIIAKIEAPTKNFSWIWILICLLILLYIICYIFYKKSRNKNNRQRRVVR